MKIDGKWEVCNDLARNVSITIGYLGPTRGFHDFHFFFRPQLPVLFFMPFLDWRNMNRMKIDVLSLKNVKFYLKICDNLS